MSISRTIPLRPILVESERIIEIEDEGTRLQMTIDVKLTPEVKAKIKEDLIKNVEEVRQELWLEESFRRSTRIFDRLAKKFDRHGLIGMIDYIKSNCKDDDAISKEVFRVPAQEAGELFEPLIVYLEERNNPILNQRIFFLFLHIEPFTWNIPDKVDSRPTPSETHNKFLETHILETSPQYLTRVGQTYELVSKIFKIFKPQLADLLPLLVPEDDIKEPTGEITPFKMAEYTIHCICYFIDETCGPEKELGLFHFPPEYYQPGSSFQIENMFIIRGNTEIMFVVVNESFKISRSNIYGMESLPVRLDPLLKQLFSHLLISGIRKVIVTNGLVYIKLDISEEVFFENPKEFTDYHIVPYTFQIMYYKDACFIAGFINWYLEAEETGESRIEQMEKYYRKPHRVQRGIQRAKRYLRSYLARETVTSAY